MTAPAMDRARRTRLEQLERGELVAEHALELRPQVVLLGFKASEPGRWHLVRPGDSSSTACGVPTTNTRELERYGAKHTRKLCGNCGRMMRVVLLDLERRSP